jgi:hypothetical protein
MFVRSIKECLAFGVWSLLFGVWGLALFVWCYLFGVKLFFKTEFSSVIK